LALKLLELQKDLPLPPVKNQASCQNCWLTLISQQSAIDSSKNVFWKSVLLKLSRLSITGGERPQVPFCTLFQAQTGTPSRTTEIILILDRINIHQYSTQ
jgi:hypothetical protein